MNTLYYGDNLEIMRRYIKNETVDLVYLDPPFKSNQDYNVLFAEQDGSRSAAQIKAFGDTWRWDRAASEAYQQIVENGGTVSETLQGFRRILGDTDMLAYLAMMAPRLVELRRALNPTGSLYLHCDPTASHYLKTLLDAVFGVLQFRTEIIWKRKSGRGETNAKSNRFGQQHDTILFYGKTEDNSFNAQFNLSAAESYVEERFKHVDEKGRRYRKSPMLSPTYRPNLIYEYKGIEAPKKGWAVSRELMEQMDDAGRLVFPKSKTGRIERKQYLDEYKGSPVQSIWSDLPFINPMAEERLGYPTQKPEALLERIIKASSKEGDIILDPFCGCGTAVSVAQRLNRQWIGIDITHLAITLIKHRLFDAFGAGIKYAVIGEPTSLPDAEELARTDPYQFQWWALGLADARPVEQKKGADKGIDGRLYFHDEPKVTKQIIFSVKAGSLHANYVRDLRGVIEREKAAIGVLITMEQPTQPMRSEAASAGFYQAPWGKACPRLQIVTVADLLSGKTVEFPRENVTFKKAPKAEARRAGNEKLPF